MLPIRSNFVGDREFQCQRQMHKGRCTDISQTDRESRMFRYQGHGSSESNLNLEAMSREELQPEP